MGVPVVVAFLFICWLPTLLPEKIERKLFGFCCATAISGIVVALCLMAGIIIEDMLLR